MKEDVKAAAFDSDGD